MFTGMVVVVVGVSGGNCERKKNTPAFYSVFSPPLDNDDGVGEESL